MKIITVTVGGEVKRSADFQSAGASFEVTMSLEEGEKLADAVRHAYRSMMAVIQEEADRALAETIRIKREVEGI